MFNYFLNHAGDASAALFVFYRLYRSSRSFFSLSIEPGARSTSSRRDAGRLIFVRATGFASPIESLIDGLAC